MKHVNFYEINENRYSPHPSDLLPQMDNIESMVFDAINNHGAVTLRQLNNILHPDLSASEINAALGELVLQNVVTRRSLETRLSVRGRFLGPGEERKEVKILISRMSRLTIHWKTDDEAGAVFGTLRSLKRNGFFQSFEMSDDHAEVNVSPEAVDIVIQTLEDLRHQKKAYGITWG